MRVNFAFWPQTHQTDLATARVVAPCLLKLIAHPLLVMSTSKLLSVCLRQTQCCRCYRLPGKAVLFPSLVPAYADLSVPHTVDVTHACCQPDIALNLKVVELIQATIIFCERRMLLQFLIQCIADQYDATNTMAESFMFYLKNQKKYTCTSTVCVLSPHPFSCSFIWWKDNALQ